MNQKTYLGIELGSTRIKAVAIDEKHAPVSSGDYTWKSTYEKGIWTYELAEVWTGLPDQNHSGDHRGRHEGKARILRQSV